MPEDLIIKVYGTEIMNREETIETLKMYKGFCLSKIQYFDEGTLTLFLKEKQSERSSFIKISFAEVLAFHDTGFVNSNISYVDINGLGFAYSYYARSKNLNPDEFNQAVFIEGANEKKKELIIVFKSISFEKS